MKGKRQLPVRLSHLLRHCSVGAIVRGPDYLMTVRDTREWTTPRGEPLGEVIHYVEQVKSALDIGQQLRMPPTAAETDRGVDGNCVPAQIFPSWMRCLRCGLLSYKPWRSKEVTFPVSCLTCNSGTLEQVSWVLAHQNGYLADVPWHFLAHRDATNREQENCQRDWAEPYLKLISARGRLTLQCQRCAAVALFDGRAHLPYTGSQQPWLRTRPEPGEQLGEILEINDARLHFAATRNALVIPPESRVRKGSVVDRLYSNSAELRKLTSATPALAKKSVLRSMADKFHCSAAEIANALEDIGNGYPLYGRQMTPGLLLESEYEALTEQIPELADDEDFVPLHRTERWQQLISGLVQNSKPARIGRLVSQVISVARLKEIMVLKGFQRISRDGPLVPPDIEGRADWLPALELYGEGIFFTLSDACLRQWESQESVVKRASRFALRYQAADFGFDPPVTVTPRFLLLHALSHMLIRELESQAGYPAASLKERIYCSTSKAAAMAGILIYVAVPDVVGSLGGLAELAEPKRLLNLLTRVFDHAEWCSLDPVCAEHEGQGPGLLNQAACHGCALLPETCCAYGNVLLDRLFIKGDRENGLTPILALVN